MQTITIKCPACNESGNLDFPLIVNANEETDLKNDVISGELFVYECSNCGARRQVNINFIYFDPQGKVLFYLLPDKADYTDLEKEQMLSQVEELVKVDLSDYILRVVGSPTELVEKVHIHERGYSDQDVELVKVLTDGLFHQENPDVQVVSRFFYAPHPLHEEKILYLTADSSKQYVVDFNDSLLTFIQDKFKKTLAENPVGEFRAINLNWASQALETL